MALSRSTVVSCIDSVPCVILKCTEDIRINQKHILSSTGKQDYIFHLFSCVAMMVLRDTEQWMCVFFPRLQWASRRVRPAPGVCANCLGNRVYVFYVVVLFFNFDSWVMLVWTSCSVAQMCLPQPYSVWHLGSCRMAGILDNSLIWVELQSQDQLL